MLKDNVGKGQVKVFDFKLKEMTWAVQLRKCTNAPETKLFCRVNWTGNTSQLKFRTEYSNTNEEAAVLTQRQRKILHFWFPLYALQLLRHYKWLRVEIYPFCSVFADSLAASLGRASIGPRPPAWRAPWARPRPFSASSTSAAATTLRSSLTDVEMKFGFYRRTRERPLSPIWSLILQKRKKCNLHLQL